MITADDVALDYVERTGRHLRVGLHAEDEGVLTAESVDLVAIAVDLADLAGPEGHWDTSHTSATTVELSFEERP